MRFVVTARPLLDPVGFIMGADTTGKSSASESERSSLEAAGIVTAADRGIAGFYIIPARFNLLLFLGSAAPGASSGVTDIYTRWVGY